MGDFHMPKPALDGGKNGFGTNVGLFILYSAVELAG